MAPPSQVSLRTEQLHADGPLIKNWRPNENAAGLPPALVDPVFGQAELVIAGGTDLDEATIEVAGKLCCTGAGIYEKEVGLHVGAPTPPRVQLDILGCTLQPRTPSLLLVTSLHVDKELPFVRVVRVPP